MDHRTRLFPRPPQWIVFATGAAAGALFGWAVARPGESMTRGADATPRAGAGTHGPAITTGGPPGAGGPAGRPSTGSRSAHAAESAAFAQSIRAIFRDNNEDRRLKTFESLLERCSLEHYEVIVSLIRENDLRGCGSGKEWSLLWANWGRRDPASGMEFITAWDWSGWHPHAAVEAKNQTLMNWAQADPESARRFVDHAIAADPEDRSYVQGLVRGLATVDPAAAAQWLFQSGLGLQGEYKTVVEAISRSGGHDALDEWFAEISRAGAPAQDVQGFAGVIAATKQAYEPDKAAAWVEQHLNEPWVHDSNIVTTTARAYAERDPRSAMEWALRTGLPQAAVPAMSAWSQKDPTAAANWLREHPESPVYSSAAYALARQLRQQDPATARLWAESIPEPEMRANALQQLGW